MNGFWGLSVLALSFVFLLVGLSVFVYAHGSHEFTCVDSDGGNNIYFKGHLDDSAHGNASYNDYCNNANGNIVTQGSNLTEYYCGNHNYHYQSYECENGCMEGKCMPKGNKVKTCKDSDGINFYSLGVTQGNDSGEYISREDKCRDGPGGNILEEGYCTDDGLPMFLQINCTNGCKSGVCLGNNNAISPCKDSDGKNPAEKGYVEAPLYNVPEEDFLQIQLFYDTCSGKEDSVLEYYCDSGMISSERISCSGSCNDGACVEETGDVVEGNNTEEKNTEKDNVGEEVDEKICSSGCFFGGECVPIGYRNDEAYCDLNNTFFIQKNADSACNNNFECTSNSCIDSLCIELGFWTKIINWFRKLF